MNSIEEKVLSLVKSPIEELGFENISVSYKKENSDNVLRILIDRDETISLDDIISVNDKISPILDKEDPIADPYMLEVTTYGVEKPIDIARLEKYLNRYINIHLTNPYKGENYLEGDLLEVNDDEISISFREKSRLIKANIKRADIDRARLAIKF